MLSVEDARARARRRVDADGRGWAVTGGEEAELSLPLGPPTERAVLADVRAALAWVESWRGVEGVQWAFRSWPSIGRQQVPERLLLRGPAAVASFGGRETLQDWKRMQRQVQMVLAAFPHPAAGAETFGDALRSKGRAVAALDERDLQRLIALLDWFAGHPDSGLRLRQLPVRGVHTKWLGAHRSLVERLHGAITGRADLGLAPSGPVLARLRVLDPALRLRGLSDLTLPVQEVATWRPLASRVIVVENLETLLALPDREGTVAIFGGGYGAGPRLAPIDWLHEVDLTYWGDLDSHGFRILDQWRSAFPGTRSVLMDEQTLLDHRDLWVEEEQSDQGVFARLNASEHAGLDRLRREGNVRLEQERIPLDLAVSRLSS